MLRLAPAVAKHSLFPVFGNHLALQTVLSVSVCVATHVLVSMDQTFALPSKELPERFGKLGNASEMERSVPAQEVFTRVTPIQGKYPGRMSGHAGYLLSRGHIVESYHSSISRCRKELSPRRESHRTDWPDQSW